MVVDRALNCIIKLRRFKKAVLVNSWPRVEDHANRIPDDPEDTRMDDAVERIRATWALAASDADTTARVFYGKLFRLDPTTKPLFVGDLALQGRKLTQTLTFIVDNLEDADVLYPAAIDLAQRHVAYGVQAAQYASVGSALMATFKQLLGPAFSPEDEAAWTKAYSGLADAMVKAAYA